MKISVEVPDAWGAVLQETAAGAGYRSVRGFVRHLVAAGIGVQDQAPVWGGKRSRQVTQDEHVEPLATKKPLIEPTYVPLEDGEEPLSDNPAVRIAQMRAKAAAKFAPGGKP